MTPRDCLHLHSNYNRVNYLLMSEVVTMPIFVDEALSFEKLSNLP